jgi:hypothetical protein
MKKYIQRWWATYFTGIGLTWMIGLTAFNTFHAYYGWLQYVYPVRSEGTEWNNEIVNECFLAFGSSISGYISQQIYPLILLCVGASSLITQNIRLNRVEPGTVINASSPAGNPKKQLND